MLHLYSIYFQAGYILKPDSSEYDRGYAHGRRVLFAAVAISVLLTKVWDDVRDASAEQKKCAQAADVVTSSDGNDTNRSGKSVFDHSGPELKS